MTEFVQHLKTLNEKIDIKLPDISIEDILKDPRQYALDFIELEFAKAIPSFVDAYNRGLDFSNANRGIAIKKSKRFYIKGGEIDSNFPDSYQLGDSLNHKNQECQRCRFYTKTKAGDYCSNWDADTKKNYWCNQWQKLK